MGDPNVIKVFHFAPFDLRFLLSGWRVTVEHVACTKAASKLLRPSAPREEHGLASLVARYAGVALDKGAVRTSDWAASVLSPQQLAYAIGDVEHLPGLLGALLTELTAFGLLDDFWNVCRYMPLDARLEVAGVPNPLTY
jgi:ribonuclease D